MCLNNLYLLFQNDQDDNYATASAWKTTLSSQIWHLHILFQGLNQAAILKTMAYWVGLLGFKSWRFADGS
jgi:uncharacterized membrane protein